MLSPSGETLGAVGTNGSEGGTFDAPPGAEAFPESLATQLREAYEAKGPAYEPRTEHLEADGRPVYVNRLIVEDSPYLIQHAHNLVSWYSWGPEAFEKA